MASHALGSTSKGPSRPLPEAPQDDSSDSEADQHPIQQVEFPTDQPEPQTAGYRTSALHKTVRTLPATSANSSELTPLRAHYLKKTLIALAVERELNALSDPALGASALGLLGHPFQAFSPEGKPIKRSELSEGSADDLPILRYLTQQFLLPFPFLASAPPTFWSGKVQPFVTSFLAINRTRLSPIAFSKNAEGDPDLSLASEEEIIEFEARKKLWEKVQKQLSMLFAAGIKLKGGEEVVRIGQADLKKLELAGEEARRKQKEREARNGPGFDVNVICVRTLTEKGRVRSKSHDEFILRTRRPNAPDVYVSRRYGDFKRLAHELRKQFPDGVFPELPPKDRTASVATPVTPSGASYYSQYNPLRAWYGTATPEQDGTSSPSTPQSNNDDFQQQQQQQQQQRPSLDEVDAYASSPLSREKNRLTLRAYLNAILAIPYALNSRVLRSFLLSGQTVLSPLEQIDAQRRAEADAVREEGKRRFKEEAEKRVEALREGLAEFKGGVLGKDGGLRGVFDVVRSVEFAKDLPPAEKSVLEWGKISLAATIFQVFVAADNASDTLIQLKRIHGMMPYFMLKGILKISNPMAMIRGLLDLFLARPFGGQSLLQRMFSSQLTEEVRLVQEDIDMVAAKIDSPLICQKIEQYVNAPFEIQTMFRKDAAEEGIDLLAIVLRSPEPPFLDRAQMQRVLKANKAYTIYKNQRDALDDSDDDEGPDNEDAWLFEDLNVLMKLMVRKKEKEQLLALIFEGTTAELLKDIITIFYSPLATVYKAASIADSLGDLQSFINDLIKTVEGVEELSQEDPGRTVQTFIDLVQRHEQAFYSFVHKVHTKGRTLFDSLMGFIELFLGFARDGVGAHVDLECILPHAGEQRMAILHEVDRVCAYHYKLKVAYEEKVRRRFAGQGANAEEAALIEGIVSSLNINGSMVEEVVQENDEDVSGESEDETSEQEEEKARMLGPTPSSEGGGGDVQAWDAPDHHSSKRGGQLKKLVVHPFSGGKSSNDPPTTASSVATMSSLSSTTPSHHGPPTPPSGRHGGGGGGSSSARQDAATRARRRALQGHAARRGQAVPIDPPELHYLPDLAPLMVEVIRPLLRVKPINANPIPGLPAPPPL